MKRNLILVLVLSVVMALGALSPGSSADAQPECSQGTLVGDQCEIEGRAPVRGAGTCPSEPDIVQNGCYRVVPGPCTGGQFEQPDGMCRSAVALTPGELGCPDAGHQVVGSKCIRYVDPTCGPLGCRGKITLGYTVECTGNGTSRVQLGTAKLVLGAQVSLITVNGSAVVGAELTAGTSITVAVTPARAGDEVMITGPTVAPPCGVAEATSTPVPVTATPEPSTATPVPAAATPVPATPIPDPATPVPTATTEAVEGDSLETLPSADPEPTSTVVIEPTPSPEPQSQAPVTPRCPEGHAAVDQRCVPPCSQAPPGTECFGVDDVTTTSQPVPITSPASDDTSGDLPLIPLALIAGATIILAPAAYLFASKRLS